MCLYIQLQIHSPFSSFSLASYEEATYQPNILFLIKKKQQMTQVAKYLSNTFSITLAQPKFAGKFTA